MAIDNSGNYKGKVFSIGSFKNGDYIDLNLPYLEFINQQVKDRKRHPFSAPNMDFLNSKFKEGVTAKVVGVSRSKDSIKYKFEFEDNDYTYDDYCIWFRRLPSVKDFNDFKK